MTKQEQEMMVHRYLVCGYLYENGWRHGEMQSYTSDMEWDFLCRSLDKYWDSIEHEDKQYIKREQLSTATASYLTQEYLPEHLVELALSGENP